MRHGVKRKQPNSKMCLVCGLKNPHGLKGEFYELDDGELVCFFRPSEEHQSYPERLHGGIVSALLDETIGRAILLRHEETLWGVTIELSVKFRKPIPLDVELRVVGRVTDEDRRFFSGTGELLLPDGTVAAEGHGRYMKLPIEKIADFDTDSQEWRVVPSEHDPLTVDL